MTREELSVVCPSCQTAAPSAALSCPQCQRLTHGPALQALAEQARAAQALGRAEMERGHWEQALRLLPEDTVQYRSIQARLAELAAQPATAETARQGGIWTKVGMAAGPVAFLLWKFKAVVLVMLTKGKVLLLGFTKIGTLLSMAASLGVYWQMYGWALAAGIVLSIYVHEMGHVIELRKYGVPATAPFFIPGFGAFIGLRAMRVAPVVDARIGLAGPVYGLGAAMLALAVYWATQAKIWAVIADWGAMINLFNLIPVWQLDGARGMRAMTRRQRCVVLGAALVLWMVTSSGMFFLVAAGVGYRLFRKDESDAGDSFALTQYLGLLAALAVVITLAPESF